LEAGYGHFFTGDYIDQTWATVGGSEDADWFYLQAVIRFCGGSDFWFLFQGRGTARCRARLRAAPDVGLFWLRLIALTIAFDSLALKAIMLPDRRFNAILCLGGVKPD
jgi:hypothetical protein